jgi:hypothetical protein
MEPPGDDVDGGGATSAEHITPNPIGSNLLGQAHTSVVDRVTTVRNRTLTLIEREDDTRS